MALYLRPLPLRKVQLVTAAIATLAVVTQPLSMIMPGTVASALSTPNSIVVNEFNANGTTDDWVELYNTTDSTIDLTGWSVHDASSKMKDLPDSLGAHAFVVVEVTNRLNQGTDDIKIVDNGNQTVNSVTYNTSGDILYPGEGKTTARVADGGSQWQVGTPTKGISNNATTISLVDTTAPVAPTITSPSSEQYFGSTPIKNQWTAVTDPSGIVSYEVEYIYDDGHTFTGGPTRLVPGTQTWRNHTPGKGEQGGVTIRVRAIDGAGNKSDYSQPVHYTYDADAPSVPVNGLPHTTSTNTNEFDFTWDASTDNTHGALVYEHQATQDPTQTNGVLTNGLLKSEGLPSPVVHSSGAGDGVWYWQVRAIDQAGNVSAWSAIWNMTIDTQAPVVTLELTSSATPNASTPISFAGTVTESANITALKLYADDVEIADITNTVASDGSWSYTLQSGLARGTYTLSAVAVDHLGNVSTLASSPASATNITVRPFTPPGGSTISPTLTSSLSNRFPTISTPRDVIAQTPVIIDEESQSDEGVLGLDTTKELDLTQMAEAPAIASSENGWRFFGIAWYWWTLLTAALAGAIWQIAAVRRNKQLL